MKISLHTRLLAADLSSTSNVNPMASCLLCEPTRHFQKFTENRRLVEIFLKNMQIVAHFFVSASSNFQVHATSNNEEINFNVDPPRLKRV